MVAPNRTADLHTVTNATLLEGLAETGNRALWQQFADRYRPIVVGFGRRMGLSDVDAEELAAASLVTFASVGRQGPVERLSGRLSARLFGIVLVDLASLRRAKATPSLPAAGSSAEAGGATAGPAADSSAPALAPSSAPVAAEAAGSTADLSAPSPSAAQLSAPVAAPPASAAQRQAWAAEWDDAVLRQCLDEVRHELMPDSYRSFVAHAIQGRPADEVAAEMGMSPEAVGLVKRRVLTRLRDLKPVIGDLY